MATKRPFSAPPGINIPPTGILNLTNTLASTATTNGVLIVAGGVGIGGSISVGGRINLFNGLNYTAFQSSASGNTVYILPATSPATGSSVLQSTSAGVLSWVPMVATGGGGSGSGLSVLNTLTDGVQFFSAGSSGSGFNISSSGSTHTFNVPIAGTAATGLVSTLAQSFAGVKTFTNNVIISSTTGSTSFNTGALLVHGGMGVSGQLSFNQASLGYTGASNPSMAFIGSTSTPPITLTVLSDNSLLWEGTSGKLFGINNNLTSGYIFNVGDMSGLPIIRAHADGTILMAEFAANVGIGLTNPSYKLHVAGDTNLSSTYVYRINGTQVLSASSLGTGVTNSSITAVGTLSTGIWAATAITALYGGTGFNSYTKGDILVGAGNTFIRLNVGTDNFVLTASSTSSTGLTWSAASASSGSGITNINSLTAIQQFFSTGTSGSIFNISSSGSTHTFNIPIAGSGSTGLVSTQSQTFAGQKTFTSAIIGDLTGTATTAGFAATSNYSLQSGYGITAGTATTATYSNQAGYATTSGSSGTATTSNYSLQSGYGVTAGLATTSIYSNQAGYAITSGSSGTATTATYANQSGYGITAGTATTSNYSLQSGYAITSGSSNTSGYATTSGLATTSLYSHQSGYGLTAGFATTAQTLNTVASGTNATHYILFSPINGGSGVAVSSDAGLFFNPGSNVLTTTTFSAGSSVNSSTASITGSTASTSSSTGALVVTGGVGIGGSLYVASATGISGVFINNGTVTGNLTGTATTANYSLQSGYGITSGTATTSNYSLQSGYGITAGTATTSNYSLQSGYGITAGTATTATNVNVVAASTSASHLVLFTPTSGSASGIAISSNSTLVYNPSTDILSVSGMAVTSNTASTSTTTGALRVTGGVGIGGSASIGGRLQMFNGANYTAFVSSASGNTVYTLPATTPSTGSSVLQSTSAGVMSWVPLTATSGIAVSGSTDGTVQFKSGSSLGATNSLFFSPSLLSLRVSGFPGGETPSGTDAALKVEQTTGSFNGSVSGTMIAVNANTGFAGDLLNLEVNAISRFKIDNTGAVIQNIGTNSTSTTSGAVQIRGGVGITGAVYIGESVNATSVTQSTNTTTGSLIVSGGAGISGALNIGGASRIFSSTASTNTSTGALLVAGGVGISGQLSFITASLGFTGVTTNPTMSFIGATSSSPITLTVLTDNSLNFEGSQGSVFSIDSNLSSGEIFSVSDISGLPIISASAGQTVNINEFGGYTQIGNGTINSSTTSNGSLVVAGGLGMTGNANIGGTVRISSGTNSASTTSGSLVVLGGLGITGNAFIGGTTTITTGTNSSSTSSGSLVVLGGLGITGNAFIGGTTTITSGTNSFSTTTGALVVNGGLGITGNANIGGTARISSTNPTTSFSTGAFSVAGGVGIGQSLIVGGNVSVSNIINSGTNTFTKAGSASGDILLDNGSGDTPGLLFYWGNNRNIGLDTYYSGSGTTRFRIVKELNETGGGELWSVDRNGIVTQSAWAAGEVIKMTVLVGADLTGGSTTTISTNSDTDVASYSYTPVSSNSYLVIEFTTRYFVVGAAADDYVSRIAVDGAEQSYNVQVWTNGAGGGTRSGTLFPLMARYTNSNTTAKTISATVRKGTTDDNATVYKDTTTVMKITEIGR
jgi:hypothetical protein